MNIPNDCLMVKIGEKLHVYNLKSFHIVEGDTKTCPIHIFKEAGVNLKVVSDPHGLLSDKPVEKETEKDFSVKDAGLTEEPKKKEPEIKKPFTPEKVKTDARKEIGKGKKDK